MVRSFQFPINTDIPKISGLNFKADDVHACGENKQACPNSSGLVEKYLAQHGLNNQVFLSTADSTSTPSGIKNYNNYVETDCSGNELVSVKYSQNGNDITQTLKTISPDGTMLEKITMNGENEKTSHLSIKDKSGNILLEKSKSYEKLDDNCARSIVNGEVYNISGLSGDVLSVEHNGEVTKLDLKKMTEESVEKITLTEDEQESFDGRKEPITDKERGILYSKIKSMGGDDLVRMSKSIDKIEYLDAPDGCMESFYNNRSLIYSKDSNPLVVLHELGHGINNNTENPEETILSDNSHLKNIRDYEIRNFKKNKIKRDEFFDNKFTNTAPLINSKQSDSDEFAQSRLRDELFAESYAVLNSTDIENYDEFIGPRTLSLIKYCPRTLAQVNYLSE